LGPELLQRTLEAEEGVKEPLAALWAWGEAEMKETQAAFAAAAKEVDPSHTPAEVYRALSQDHPKAEAGLPKAEETLAKLRALVQRRKLLTLPDDANVHVAPTPRFENALSFASLSMPGALETHATDAFYYVTVPDQSWSAKRVAEHLSFFNRWAL